MCTLILGVDTVAPSSVLLATNRDEDPARPGEPPGVLREAPRVVGGHDRLSGGTWLAVRERRSVVAMLNRRDRSGAPSPRDPARRSRGLLALDVAAADDALETAMRAVHGGLYAPFTLVHATPEHAWSLEFDGAAARLEVLAPGWHVVTHASPDDRAEPRTGRLLDALEGYRPASRAEAEERLAGMLRWHADGPARPPVCVHEGPMVTVSSARVWLAGEEARYAHAEGRPCEVAFEAYDGLLG